jgi:hypothetical protein
LCWINFSKWAFRRYTRVVAKDVYGADVIAYTLDCGIPGPGVADVEPLSFHRTAPVGKTPSGLL